MNADAFKRVCTPLQMLKAVYGLDADPDRPLFIGDDSTLMDMDAPESMPAGSTRRYDLGNDGHGFPDETRVHRGGIRFRWDEPGYVVRRAPHTPTPWMAIPSTGGGTRDFITAHIVERGAPHAHVAQVMFPARDYAGDVIEDLRGANENSNAEFIVRCVNAHDELVAALRFAAEKLDDAIRLAGCSASSYARARDEARAALAKVERS